MRLVYIKRYAKHTFFGERTRLCFVLCRDGQKVVSHCPIGSRVTKEKWDPVLVDWIPERKVNGGGCRSFRKRSLDLKTMRYFAEWSPRCEPTKNRAGERF